MSFPDTLQQIYETSNLILSRPTRSRTPAFGDLVYWNPNAWFHKKEAKYALFNLSDANAPDINVPTPAETGDFVKRCFEAIANNKDLPTSDVFTATKFKYSCSSEKTSLCTVDGQVTAAGVLDASIKFGFRFDGKDQFVMKASDGFRLDWNVNMGQVQTSLKVQTFLNSKDYVNHHLGYVRTLYYATNNEWYMGSEHGWGVSFGVTADEVKQIKQSLEITNTNHQVDRYSAAAEKSIYAFNMISLLRADKQKKSAVLTTSSADPEFKSSFSISFQGDVLPTESVKP